MRRNTHRGHFIERSLVGILVFLKASLFAQEHALKRGFMQSLDPRVKIITFALLIALALFSNSIAVLCLYLFCLILAGISKIRLGFFLKRTWVFIPLFSLFIALPALFSNFSPGPALFSFKLAKLTLIITRPGALSAALFILRVITCVSFAVLLNITTLHFELLRALRVFGIPQVFTMVLGVSYRYIYLFLGIIENTYLAIKSRVGIITHYKKGRHIVAWNISALWQRSYQLNEDVYKSMLSRGYGGEAALLDGFKARAKDWFWLVFTGGMFACLIWFFR